jgi:hypothetical protein
MRVVLKVLAIGFFIAWLVGVFIFGLGLLIHILLVLAIFSFIINFLSEPV